MDIPIVRSEGVQNNSDIQLVIRPDAELLPRVWGNATFLQSMQQPAANYIELHKH
jgi:hypothetical protein